MAKITNHPSIVRGHASQFFGDQSWQGNVVAVATAVRPHCPRISKARDTQPRGNGSYRVCCSSQLAPYTGFPH